MAAVSYGTLKFSEQIAFFRRKLNVTTQSWLDVYEAEHDHAFMVAGANRMDLVQDFREAIDAAISQGETLAQFRKRFDTIVAKYGWDYNGGRNWRSRVIYETNLRTSYAAGRWAQLQELKQFRPYWQYYHAPGEMHPRPLHLKWGQEKLTLHADDPWWHTHFPPNGWGCQCTVHAVDDRDLARQGKSGPDTAPPDDMQPVTIGQRSPGGARTVETPAGVDPGFGYAPGRDAWLREQARHALETENAVEDAWTTAATDDAASMRLPAVPQAVPAPVPLGPDLAGTPAVAEEVNGLLGASSRVFDVHGLPVAAEANAVAAETVYQGGDATLLPLLVDTLSDPTEVWVAPQTAQDGTATRLRTTLVKRYELPSGRTVTLLVQVERGIVVRWRAVDSGDSASLVDARSGYLWYGGGYGRRSR